MMKPQLGDSARFWALYLNKDVSKLQVKVKSRIRSLESMTYKRRAIEKELFGLKCKDWGGNVKVYHNKKIAIERYIHLRELKISFFLEAFKDGLEKSL